MGGMRDDSWQCKWVEIGIVLDIELFILDRNKANERNIDDNLSVRIENELQIENGFMDTNPHSIV